MNDLLTLLPLISLMIAGASFYFARKHDTKNDTMQQTEVVIEIRAMRSDVQELKSDMKALRAEYKADHDEIVGMKRDFKTMWTRIDELKNMVSKAQGGKQS